MKLIEPWTFLGVNIHEWYLGFIAFMLSSLAVSNLTNAMPIMVIAFISFPFLLSILRRKLRNNSNVIVENLMYVWDVGVLKQKLSCPQTTSKTAFRFLLLIMASYSFGLYCSANFTDSDAVIDNNQGSITVTGSVIIFVGLIMNYLANGGDKGRQFLEKVVPLYSVEGMLIGPLVLLVFLIFMFASSSNLTIENMSFNNYAKYGEILFLLVLFLRTNFHLLTIKNTET